MKSLKSRLRLLLPYATLAFCQRCAMCCLHLAGHFVILLLRGFAHELACPHEFVPVDFGSFVDGHLCTPMLPNLSNPTIDRAGNLIETQRVVSRPSDTQLRWRIRSESSNLSSFFGSL